MLNSIVNFEISKVLKEKGWDKGTLCYYFEDGEFRENSIKDIYGYYGEEYTVEYSELLNNWNDNFIQKKNGDRCFGCDKNNSYFETFSAPSIAQVVDFLLEEYNIYLYCEIGENPTNFYPIIININKKRQDNFEYSPEHWRDTLKEAYEKGIEYIIKNNLI